MDADKTIIRRWECVECGAVVPSERGHVHVTADDAYTSSPTRERVFVAVDALLNLDHRTMNEVASNWHIPRMVTNGSRTHDAQKADAILAAAVNAVTGNQHTTPEEGR